MGFIKEFKDFAMRGNLIDFAVGVVVGGAFGKVTTSFVDGIIMPVIGKLIGGQDFSDLKFKIQDGSKAIMDSAGNITTKEVPEVFIKYGEFITTVIDFMAVAFAMFLVIKAMNRLKNKEAEAPAPPPAPTKEEILLTDIRDLLKK
ncbi:MAG: large-conductance mechanosensitive channel protein MscL [Bacteroidetes bacterium]|nr:large-conductance mechanosensitive channel protein MscL [Bacteroidota bacterium]